MWTNFGKELKVVFGYFIVFVGFLAIQDNGGIDHYLWEDYIFDGYWWRETGVYVLAITAVYLIVSVIWKLIREFIYMEIFKAMNRLEDKKRSKV